MLRQAFKARQRFQEGEFDRARGAIPLFGDDDFGYAWLFAVFVVVIVAVDKHDDVGILLNRARFAQVTCPSP